MKTQASSSVTLALSSDQVAGSNASGLCVRRWVTGVWMIPPNHGYAAPISGVPIDPFHDNQRDLAFGLLLMRCHVRELLTELCEQPLALGARCGVRDAHVLVDAALGSASLDSHLGIRGRVPIPRRVVGGGHI